jgi:glycogen synthase
VARGCELRSEPVRILHVTWEYPPLVVGGLAPHVHGIATAQAAAGHHVVVLTRHHPDAPDDAVIDGVRVVRAHSDLPWVPEEQFETQVISANHKLVQLTATIRPWAPEVIHAHDWLVAWAADTISALSGAPIVATVHATERGRHHGQITNRTSAGVDAAEWWMTYQAKQVICCSTYMVNEVTTAWELPAAKVSMIPNGVTGADWRLPAASVPPRVGGPLVVSWGRLQYEKGFHVLLDAVALMGDDAGDIEVVIVGRGTYTEDLRRKTLELGLADRVHFAGFVSDHDLKVMLHQAACAVIPSLYEPFGIVALEALAAGAPLVASTAGGLAEVLGGTNAARLVEPDNAEQLADAITATIRDVAATKLGQERGATLVDTRYAWSAIAADTVEVYRKALAP